MPDKDFPIKKSRYLTYWELRSQTTYREITLFVEFLSNSMSLGRLITLHTIKILFQWFLIILIYYSYFWLFQLLGYVKAYNTIITTLYTILENDKIKPTFSSHRNSLKTQNSFLNTRNKKKWTSQFNICKPKEVVPLKNCKISTDANITNAL